MRVEVVVHELFVCLIINRYWLVCILAHVDDRRVSSGLLVLQASRVLINLIRVESSQLFLLQQVAAVFNQSASDASIKPSLFNLIKLEEHQSDLSRLKCSDSLRETLLNVLIEQAFALETELGVAIVKGGNIDGFHLLIPAFKFLLEPDLHLLIEIACLHVRSEHLAEFDRIHLVHYSHHCWLDI